MESERGQRRSLTGRSLFTLANMLNGLEQKKGGYRRELVLKGVIRLGVRATHDAEAAVAEGRDDAKAFTRFSTATGEDPRGGAPNDDDTECCCARDRRHHHWGCRCRLSPICTASRGRATTDGAPGHASGACTGLQTAD